MAQKQTLAVQLANPTNATSRQWQKTWQALPALCGEDVLYSRLLSMRLFELVKPLPVPPTWTQRLQHRSDVVHLFTATRGVEEQCFVVFYHLAWGSEQEKQQFQRHAESKGAHTTWAADRTTMIEVACFVPGVDAGTGCCNSPASHAATADAATDGSVGRTSSSTDFHFHSRSSSSSSSLQDDLCSCDGSVNLHEQLIQSIDMRWKQALDMRDAMEPVEAHAMLTLGAKHQQQQQHCTVRLAHWSSATAPHWGISAGFRSRFPYGPATTPTRAATTLTAHFQPLAPVATWSRKIPARFARDMADLRRYYTFYSTLQPQMPQLLERARQRVIQAVAEALPKRLRHRVRRCLRAEQRQAEAAAVCLLAHMVMFDAPVTVGTVSVSQH